MNKLILFTGAILILDSCSRFKKEQGYIVFTDEHFFNFVPVKSTLKTNSSISSFYTDNLREGFEFRSKNYKTFNDSTFYYVDTFSLKDINKDFPREYITLKVMPVYIEYRKIEYPKMNVVSKSKCTYKINDRIIEYIINHDQYEIRKILALNYDGRNKFGYFWKKVEGPLE